MKIRKQLNREKQYLFLSKNSYIAWNCCCRIQNLRLNLTDLLNIWGIKKANHLEKGDVFVLFAKHHVLAEAGDEPRHCVWGPMTLSTFCSGDLGEEGK